MNCKSNDQFELNEDDEEHQIKNEKNHIQSNHMGR